MNLNRNRLVLEVNMKLSIIVPVYNVEQYIAKCLESCLQQDLRSDEFEILVVNDGTPDNSVAIVEKYAQTASNIRLVHRPNGGLSAARNTGLKEALGEYVWFVDSDDWITPNCLGELVDTLQKGQLDCLCVNLQLVYEDGKIAPYHIAHEKSGRIYCGQDFIAKVGMPPAAWLALYRRDYLLKNGLKFYEGILHEDQEFTPRAYCLASRIAYIDKVVYNYLQRTGSIMKSNRNAKRCKDLLVVADSLYRFASEKVAKDTLAYQTIIQHVNFAFSQSLAYYQREMFPLSVYRQKSYYPLSTAGLNPSLKVKYTLMNLSLSLYLKIYSKLRK